MMHKSEDYKISAVKYYLKNKDNIRKTCKIFDCKKSTLQRWIQRYNSTKNLTRRNRKPFRSGNVLVHGLICCKNGCGYWNRDVNGSTNIYKIAYNAINNKERPNYLSRSKNTSTGLDEPVKPKFTCLEIGKPC